MSRVSNNPILVPDSVKINIDNKGISIKGVMGDLYQEISNDVALEHKDNILRVKILNDTKHANAMAGTIRSLISNMIHGVSIGFEKRLQLVGVGYRAQASNSKINLALGYSHPIEHVVPTDIKIETPTQTEIVIKGADKQKVGQVAADLRAYRKPEPYKGKGVRYLDEIIVLKETKKK